MRLLVREAYMSGVGSILTNAGALAALNSIAQTSQATDTLQNELASGLAINTPSDNPAGYITAQGFASQINGLTQATSNANQGISLLQTAQNGIGQQVGIVQQLNSIAVQAANGTQTPEEAQSLQTLVAQLTDQVSTIANQTQFNNINLLDGSFSNQQFQIGANEGQTMDLSIGSTAAESIGMYSSTNLVGSGSKYTGAGSSSAALTRATSYVSSGGGTTSLTRQAMPPVPWKGAFTPTSSNSFVSIAGTNGTPANIHVQSSTETAASLAAAINAATTQTGVTASATTSMAMAVGGGADGKISFRLQASGGGISDTIGPAISISVAANANGIADAIKQINGETSDTGITASEDQNGNLVLQQTSGQNIRLEVTDGSLTPSGQSPITGIPAQKAVTSGPKELRHQAVPAAPSYVLIQGGISLASKPNGFSITNGSNIGIDSASTTTTDWSKTGAFTVGSIGITGSNGATTAVSVNPATQSAASLAAAVNATSAQTGVQATAKTEAVFTFTPGAGGNVSFKLQADNGSGGTNSAIGQPLTVSATSVAQAVSQINKNTANSGITASIDGNGQLVLTQSDGQNIQLTVTNGTLSQGPNGAGTNVSGAPTSPSSVLVQGHIEFQSGGAFSVTNAAAIGLNASSTLQALSSINVAAGGSISTNISTNLASLYPNGPGSAAAQPQSGGNAASFPDPGKGIFAAPGSIGVTGANGNVVNVSINPDTESAALVANEVNQNSATTGVTAQAVTTISMAATFPLSLALLSDNGNGTSTSSVGEPVNVSGAANIQQAVSQINASTANSGITASIGKDGNLVLTQAAGQNIQLTVNEGSLTAAGQPAITGNAPSTYGHALIQGQVTFHSASAFSITNGSSIGVASASTVKTINTGNDPKAGANRGLTIIQYAMSDLTNIGGQLGAVQNRLTDTVANLTSTTTNAKTALGVVQDANIPQVANQLTQEQIMAQAGVSALKSSTELQQTYLSLLP